MKTKSSSTKSNLMRALAGALLAIAPLTLGACASGPSPEAMNNAATSLGYATAAAQITSDVTNAVQSQYPPAPPTNANVMLQGVTAGLQSANAIVNGPR